MTTFNVYKCYTHVPDTLCVCACGMFVCMCVCASLYISRHSSNKNRTEMS